LGHFRERSHPRRIAPPAIRRQQIPAAAAGNRR
jgi:hypothetical protein